MDDIKKSSSLLKAITVKKMQIEIHSKAFAKKFLT